MQPLPPLDLHAHVSDVGATPVAAGARVFGQSMTPAEWDAVSATGSAFGIVWGLGLHPIYTASRADLDAFLDRLTRSAAVGEVGLDSTGLSPLEPREQRRFLAAVLSRTETRNRLVSLHALQAYDDVVAMLADHTVPGAVLHWFCAPDRPLRRAVELDVFFSVNDAIAADPAQAVVLPHLPRSRVLVETDAPYIERGTGRPLNPWADTEAERRAGRSLRAGEVSPMEQTLADLWKVDPPEVRTQLWRNLAELESRVAVRPFGAAEVLVAAGWNPVAGDSERHGHPG